MRTDLLQRIFLSSVILFPLSILAQRSELATCLNPEGKSAREEVNKTVWIEDVSERTVKTATYYSEDGQVRIRHSSRPINYYNEEGELVPIIKDLEQTGEDFWSAPNQPYPTYLFADGSMALTNADKSQTIKFGKNCTINKQVVNSRPEVTESGVLISDVAPGIDKMLYYRENGVKYNYVIDQNLNSEYPLVFAEEIELPDGYALKLDKERGELTDFGWAGLINVINLRTGQIEATFHEPVCFDSNNKYMVAGYEISVKENKKYELRINVDPNWLNDSERAYPVVIDPIVTGPTTTWTGGQMPSCFVPSYNVDSILVYVPSSVTITMLNITASFYADPWTPALMQDGQMFFSTSCDNSQTFSITGSAGATAGTAYLDYYNIFNPLTCCIPEICNTQSFYLSYHLGRTALGSGCNTTYIRYDPSTTSWPFEAEVVGKTPESYGAQWNVPAAQICADQCEISGIAYVYYGVPPYTFTHPWSTDTITQGTNIGCGNGSTTAVFDLTIPNCPVYCDTINTTLAVPPPTIIDACGNAVSGLPSDQVPLKPVPNLNPIYDPEVCSGEPFVIDMNSCISAADVTWQYWWDLYSGNIEDTLTNYSSSTDTITYRAWATLNGCVGDTFDIDMYVQPNPSAAYTTNPSPIVSGVEASFSDASNFNGATGIAWYYVFGDGDDTYEQNPNHTYMSPGDYLICMGVVDDAGCTDTVCGMVTVVPAEVELPNVVTANNDEINDLLAFKYLEFYPNNRLTVLNRWGTVVYEKTGYVNDWNPKDLSEGVYYYVLEVIDIDKKYDGFFHLVK